MSTMTIRDRARLEAGNPPTDEVSNALIEGYIVEALDRIDVSFPTWAVFYITTVANQQSYVIDTTVENVLFVDWRGDARLSEVFDADFNALDFQFYDVESDRYKRVKDAMVIKQMNEGYDWRYNEKDKTLWLLPCPTTAGKKVYYVGQIPWTLTTLPIRFEKLIVWYVTAQTMIASARKKRRLSAIAHTGDPMQWSLSDTVLSDAKALMEQFEDELAKESKKALFKCFL